MNALYVIALAIIGNGIYSLAHGKSMEGFAEIVVAVGAVIVVLVYQHAEREKEVGRKRRPLKPPLKPSRRPKG